MKQGLKRTRDYEMERVTRPAWDMRWVFGRHGWGRGEPALVWNARH